MNKEMDYLEEVGDFVKEQIRRTTVCAIHASREGRSEFGARNKEEAAYYSLLLVCLDQYDMYLKRVKKENKSPVDKER